MEMWSLIAPADAKIIWGMDVPLATVILQNLGALLG